MRLRIAASFGNSVSMLRVRNSRATFHNLFLASVHFPLDINVCLLYIFSMKRISMFLSEPQIAALKKLAKRTGIKVSELVRRFIDEGLKKA